MVARKARISNTTNFKYTNKEMTDSKTKNKKREVKSKEIEELREQVKRSLADYQNLEKRVLQQRQEWARLASREILLKILPILDTLMIAQKIESNEALTVSIQQFLSALKSEGVEKAETVGKMFDPVTMECIQTVSSSQEEDGMVIEEIRAGFVQYDKVIRPAQVIVGKKGN